MVGKALGGEGRGEALLLRVVAAVQHLGLATSEQMRRDVPTHGMDLSMLAQAPSIFLLLGPGNLLALESV